MARTKAGTVNELTTVLELAEDEVAVIEAAMLERYGLALYVEQAPAGAGAALVWPSDPEQLTPEQMQELLDTRGEVAVNQWLLEHYMALGVNDPEAIGGPDGV